jgi:hypothetical protein
LRKYSVLTVGDIVSLRFNDERMKVTISSVEPDSSTHAICVTDSDTILEFEKPLEFHSPQHSRALYRRPSSDDRSDEEEDDDRPVFRPFSGRGYSLVIDVLIFINFIEFCLIQVEFGTLYISK